MGDSQRDLARRDDHRGVGQQVEIKRNQVVVAQDDQRLVTFGQEHGEVEQGQAARSHLEPDALGLGEDDLIVLGVAIVQGLGLG